MGSPTTPIKKLQNQMANASRTWNDTRKVLHTVLQNQVVMANEIEQLKGATRREVVAHCRRENLN